LLTALESEAPDLAAVVRRWATLPPAVKASIVTITEAVQPDSGGAC
jgi:hypothetical protein